MCWEQRDTLSSGSYAISERSTLEDTQNAILNPQRVGRDPKPLARMALCVEIDY
jgi:hypothetical protein